MRCNELLLETVSISRWIPSHAQPSSNLVQYLSTEILHILPVSPSTQKAVPGNFYSGLDVGFAPIYENFDVRRQAIDDLLNRVVLSAHCINAEFQCAPVYCRD